MEGELLTFVFTSKTKIVKNPGKLVLILGVIVVIVLIVAILKPKPPLKSMPTETPHEDYVMTVSFEIGSHNMNDGITVSYTNDADSLWSNPEWVWVIKEKMTKRLSQSSTVLLFDSKENAPNVQGYGMSYPERYDQHLVCGLWVYPNGSSKFCYGGMKVDGNFRSCD